MTVQWFRENSEISCPCGTTIYLATDELIPIIERLYGRLPKARGTMEAPPVERHLAAILAADVEGYSRLMHGEEETTLATLSAYRAVVDQLIAVSRSDREHRRR
jgi:class 3 adenylate cyclase